MEKNGFILTKKREFMQFLNEFSKGILVPVFTLPIVGIILAFGILLSNPSLPLGKIPVFFATGKIITNSLISIFINLSPLFCVGIAAGMAKKKRGEAGLNSLILFFVFIYAMNSYMSLKGLLLTGPLSGTGQSMVLGVQVLDMGVFLGMLIGVISAKLHNRFIDVE
ncbi:MAG: PTS transporter subunit EIIC, partial [Cetobacterium sp.]